MKRISSPSVLLSKQHPNEYSNNTHEDVIIKSMNDCHLDNKDRTTNEQQKQQLQQQQRHSIVTTNKKWNNKKTIMNKKRITKPIRCSSFILNWIIIIIIIIIISMIYSMLIMMLISKDDVTTLEQNLLLLRNNEKSNIISMMILNNATSDANKNTIINTTTIDSIEVMKETTIQHILNDVPNMNVVVRHEHDMICNDCRYEFINNAGRYYQYSCYYMMNRYRKMDNNNKLSIIEAGIKVSIEYPESCSRCHPKNCNDYSKIYYHPDDIMNSFIEYATTIQLKSIHSNNRIPTNVFNSPNLLTSYLLKIENIYPNKQYLYEYNPSIIILPLSQRLIHINAIYMISFRVSSIHNCLVKPNDTLHMIGNNWNYRSNKYDNDYLGISILDINLNIILETVIDIKRIHSTFQDGRLYVFNEQIYISSYHIIFPIWIIPPISPNEKYNLDGDTYDFHEISAIAPHYYNTTSTNPNNTILTVYVRRNASCSSYRRSPRQFGKNYNYFMDPTNHNIIIEIFPMGSKEILYTNRTCLHKKTKKELNSYKNKENNPFLPQSYNQSNGIYPTRSFGTIDEFELIKQNIYVSPYTFDSGSICCVSIIDPRNSNKSSALSTLLLGILHSKTPKIPKRPSSSNTTHKTSADDDKNSGVLLPNHYFSSFYVMEPYEPYNVIARTGRLCFGYPIPMKENVMKYPRLYVDPLRIGNHTYYKCPRIHFVSGMTEKYNDPNKVIISYGIDDCISRFIVIDKNHIIRLLFHPHEMILYNHS